MRWIVTLIGTALMVVVTVAAYGAATAGTGLPGLLERPVSVRQGSVRGTGGHRGAAFYYFGTHSRSHMGGGYGFGK
jgi:hypothetical protein